MVWRAAAGVLLLGLMTAAACGGDDNPTFGGGSATTSAGGAGGEGSTNCFPNCTTSSTGGGGTTASGGGQGGAGGEGGVCTSSGETCDTVPTCGPLDDGCGNVSDCAASCGDPDYVTCNANGWCQGTHVPSGDALCASQVGGGALLFDFGIAAPANKIPPSCLLNTVGGRWCCQCCSDANCSTLCP